MLPVRASLKQATLPLFKNQNSSSRIKLQYRDQGIMIEDKVENINKNLIMQGFVGLGEDIEIYSKHYTGMRDF